MVTARLAALTFLVVAPIQQAMDALSKSLLNSSSAMAMPRKLRDYCYL